MDLPQAFGAWRKQAPEQWLALVNRVVPPIVVVALVIFLAFQAAGLTWRLLEQPTRQDEVPPAVLMAVAELPRSGGGNLSALSGWEPFGSAPEQNTEARPAEDFIDAPMTELNLRLALAMQFQETPERGSMVIAEEGSAVIELAGGMQTQKTYHTGDTIEGTGVKLHSVFADCAMLDPGTGQLERLCFQTAEELAAQSGRPGTAMSRSTPAPMRVPQQGGTPAATVQNITNAASVFSTHVQLRQHIDGDTVVGWRMEPRNDSPVMAQLGLEPGDVLTEVNGVRLGDLRNLNGVLAALQETPQANVKIRRNGVDVPMTIDLNQVTRLVESLQ